MRSRKYKRNDTNSIERKYVFFCRFLSASEITLKGIYIDQGIEFYIGFVINKLTTIIDDGSDAETLNQKSARFRTHFLKVLCLDISHRLGRTYRVIMEKLSQLLTRKLRRKKWRQNELFS